MTGLTEFSADLEALAKLLQHEEVVEGIPKNNNDISRPSLVTPASIGPKNLLPVRVASPRAHDTKDIWTADEAECTGIDDVDDGRDVPEFEFKYKQDVTTSDNYLGISGKDPSTSCCEELVVVLQLPQARSAAELELDVTSQHLRLSSPKYKLSIHLPHKVNSERGIAKWDSKKQVLRIIMPIIHEDNP